MNGLDDVLTFMRHHVFCVWDFMSLLKGLQRRLTCVDVPWLPSPDPVARRLLNEIVLAEESDEDGQGGWLSHFELYLAAMREAGADVAPVGRFVDSLRDGTELKEAFGRAEAPPAMAASVRLSCDLARNAETHRLAAAFALGREDIIPSLFLRLLDRLAMTEPARFGKFRITCIGTWTSTATFTARRRGGWWSGCAAATRAAFVRPWKRRGNA